jgi:YggT family protein
MIIFFRIILSWFGGGYGRTETLLRGITDPYLNWFRRFTFLRIGNIDLSPIAGMALLSFLNMTFSRLAVSGTLSLGIILAEALRIVWSVVSFFLGFGIIILVLRLIAYLTSQNTFGRFWGAVDAISQPIVYRINRLIFGGKIIHYLTGILVSICVLLICTFIGGALARFLSNFILRLPV